MHKVLLYLVGEAEFLQTGTCKLRSRREKRLCPSWYLLLVAEKIVVVNISNGAFVTDWAIVSLVPR